MSTILLKITANGDTLPEKLTGVLQVNSENDFKRDFNLVIENTEPLDSGTKLKISKGDELFIDTDFDKLLSQDNFSSPQQAILAAFMEPITQALARKSQGDYERETSIELEPDEYEIVKTACA